jgi:hypothetical protein
MAKPLQTSYWEVLFLRFHIGFARLILIFLQNLIKKLAMAKRM